MAKERKNKMNVLTGSAGEYFVAAELSRRGVVAALTMAGTDAFDILAVNKAGKSCAIQVKTTQYEKASWLLSSKDETPKADFYVFVRLNGESLPDYYIMHSHEQNRQKEQPTNKANGNRKNLGHLKGAKTIAR